MISVFAREVPELVRNPVLVVILEGVADTYTLNKADLWNVFSKYGDLHDVEVVTETPNIA